MLQNFVQNNNISTKDYIISNNLQTPHSNLNIQTKTEYLNKKFWIQNKKYRNFEKTYLSYQYFWLSVKIIFLLFIKIKDMLGNSCVLGRK